MGSGASLALPFLTNELSQDDVKRLCGARFDQIIFDSLKDRGGTVTKEQFLVAVQAHNEKRLHLLFATLCPTGDMDSRNFLKICREIGQTASPNKKFSNPDADIIFQKVRSEYVASKYIDYETFRSKAMPQLATRIGVEINELLSAAGLIDPAVLTAGTNRLSSTDHQDEFLRRNSNLSTEVVTDNGNSTTPINISRASHDAGISVAAVRRGSATFPSTTQTNESKQINEMAAAMLRASQSEATTLPIIINHTNEGAAPASTSTAKKRRASMNTISLVVSKPLSIQTNNNNTLNMRRATLQDPFSSPANPLVSPTTQLTSPTTTTTNVRRVTYNSSEFKSTPTLPTIDGSPPDTTITISTAATNPNTTTTTTTAAAAATTNTTATTGTATSGLSRHEQKIQYFQRQQQAKLEAARLKEQQALEDAEG